jgi:hypothetical protein
VHVVVVESGPDAANVQVHLPLSLVRIALEMAPDDVILDGKLELNDSDFTVQEFRRLWSELRAAGDAAFVTVEKPDHTVRLSRKGDRLLVDVRGRPTDGAEGRGSDETVRAEIPLAVVDALLAGEGERLDLAAAIGRLSSFRGPILEVRDPESHVQIWIDEKGAPKP